MKYENFTVTNQSQDSYWSDHSDHYPDFGLELKFLPKRYVYKSKNFFLDFWVNMWEKGERGKYEGGKASKLLNALYGKPLCSGSQYGELTYSTPLTR